LAGPVGFVGRHTRREPTTYGLRAATQRSAERIFVFVCF